MNDRLKALEQTIRERRDADPQRSYVASLRAKGRAKMAEKIGEEATEVVIAAIQDDSEAMKGEAADLLFHLMVLLADMDMSLEEAIAELGRREGLSGLEEKASRGVS
ncbi:MAG: phosphoribosyl-ATP diphosphatase [Parasphingorhabdus sp.]